MNLIEEAVIIEIFGIRMYAFGVYAALGTLLAYAVLAVAGRALSLRKGTVPLTALISTVCGLMVSRLCFCLLNRELGRMTPLSFWPQLNGGGWSMFGLIAGVFLGGRISAAIMREKTGSVLDSLSLAILPMIAAERIGESRIEDFDISRPLDSSFLTGSFLAVGEDEPCLATYYVAAAVAIVIFIILVFRFARTKKEGNLAVEFLLLFGGASIITESLRYDRFLSISFVGMQQVAAAVMLALGVILALLRSNKKRSAFAAASAVCLTVMVGAVIGLEFALDRTTWNKILIYALMIGTVAVPVGLGLIMLKGGTKGSVTRE